MLLDDKSFSLSVLIKRPSFKYCLFANKKFIFFLAVIVLTFGIIDYCATIQSDNNNLLMIGTPLLLRLSP